MKKISLFMINLFFCLLSGTGISMADTDVLVYCDSDYPPYSYLEGDEIKGIYT